MKEGNARVAKVDCWRLLGISSDAGPAEVRGAFARRARDVHPDSGGTGDGLTLRLLAEARDEALAYLGERNDDLRPTSQRGERGSHLRRIRQMRVTTPRMATTLLATLAVGSSLASGWSTNCWPAVSAARCKHHGARVPGLLHASRGTSQKPEVHRPDGLYGSPATLGADVRVGSCYASRAGAQPLPAARTFAKSSSPIAPQPDSPRGTSGRNCSYSRKPRRLRSPAQGRGQLGHRLPRIIKPLAELAGEVLLDTGRVAGLALAHGPQPVRRPHHRHRPAEQVDVELLALGRAARRARAPGRAWAR